MTLLKRDGNGEIREMANKQMLDIRFYEVNWCWHCKVVAYKYKCEHQFSCTAFSWSLRLIQTNRQRHASLFFLLNCLEMRSWNLSAKLCALCKRRKKKSSFQAKRDKRTDQDQDQDHWIFYFEIILNWNQMVRFQVHTHAHNSICALCINKQPMSIECVTA